MMHSSRPFAIAGAVFMLLGAAPVVQAQSANVFTFQTDQATLRTEAGTLETYERLVTQTGQYCEQFDLGVMSEQCEAEVLAAAIAQVDSPGLATLHTARLAEQARHARQDTATPTS